MQYFPIRGIIPANTPFFIIDSEMNVFTIDENWASITETSNHKIAILKYTTHYENIEIYPVTNANYTLTVIPQLGNPEVGYFQFRTGENPVMMQSASINNGWQVLVTGAYYRAQVGIASTKRLILIPGTLYGTDSRTYRIPDTYDIVRSIDITGIENQVRYFADPEEARIGMIYRYCYSSNCGGCKGPCRMQFYDAFTTDGDNCLWTESEAERVDPKLRELRRQVDYAGFRCVIEEIPREGELDQRLILAIMLIIGGGGILILWIILYYAADKC